MNFYIIFVIFVSVASAQNCNNNSLLNSITLEQYFNGQLNWPINLGEVNDLCNKLYTGYASVKDFTNRCFNNNLRELREIPDGLEDQYDEICESNRDRQRFLNQIQCYNTNGQVKGELKQVHQRFVAMVEKLSSYSQNVRLQAYFCAVLYFREAARSIHNRLCSYDTAEYFDDIIEEYEFFDCPFIGDCDNVRSFQVCTSRIDQTSAAELQSISTSQPQPAQSIALPTVFKLYA